MALLNKRRVVLAKIEGTYGTDPTPTGAANAMLVSNLDITPLDAKIVERNVIRSFLGNADQLMSSVNVGITFDIELAGSGTAGVAPAYGPILRACGFAETLTAAAVTGTAQAGGTTTSIKLAAGASASDDFYDGMTVTITGGTGSGQTGVIVDYNGTTKVATIASAWASGPDATSGYSIAANAQYKPISTAFESVTIYYGVDGVQHKLTGVRGNVSFDFSEDQIPMLKFRGVGIYNAPTDTALPTGVYTAFQQPLPANRINTPYLALHGYASAMMSSLTLDMANDVVFRSMIGGTAGQVLITDRKPKGDFLIEATTIAAKDWWTAAKNGTTGTLAITHGSVAGNKVQLAAPSIVLTGPTYQDQESVAMVKASYVPVPITGNDELALVVM